MLIIVICESGLVSTLVTHMRQCLHSDSHVCYAIFQRIVYFRANTFEFGN